MKSDLFVQKVYVVNIWCIYIFCYNNDVKCQQEAFSYNNWELSVWKRCLCSCLSSLLFWSWGTWLRNFTHLRIYCVQNHWHIHLLFTTQWISHSSLWAKQKWMYSDILHTFYDIAYTSQPEWWKQSNLTLQTGTFQNLQNALTT